MHTALTISEEPMPGLKLLDRLLSAIAIKTPTGSSRVLLSMGSGFFFKLCDSCMSYILSYSLSCLSQQTSKMTIRSSELLPPAPVHYA